LSQLPDPGSPAEVARLALGGIKEAIKVGREIKQAGAEVNSFLDEEARARIAWKKKQLQLERRGDLVFVDAATEYREVRKEFQRMRAEERLTWILIFLFAGIIYGIFKITGVW